VIIDFCTTVGQGITEYFRPEDLLDEMNQNQVDMAVIAPADQYLAVYNQEGNDYIAEMVRKYPHKFIGFGCVSPWYGEKAVDEVYRIKSLGLKGIKMEPFIQGFMLSDRITDGILTACEETALPVLVATGTPISSMPLQLRELALRFPKVNFIMGHMGFSDFWYDVSIAAENLDNMYMELSYQMPSVIIEAIARCGRDKVLFGSDWPFSREKIEMAKVGLTEDEEDKKHILGENAMHILNITEEKR